MRNRLILLKDRNIVFVPSTDFRVLDAKGSIVTPSQFPLRCTDFASYLDGSISIPNVNVPESVYNGVQVDEVTPYAKDVFMAMEAIKAKNALLTSDGDKGE